MATISKNPLQLRTVILYVLILGMVGLMVAYAVFQGRLLIEGPVILIENPPPTVQPDPFVVLSGQAQNIVALTLNDKPIFTDEKGNFTERVILAPGYTIMTLRAEDRYGRETALTYPVMHTAAQL